MPRSLLVPLESLAAQCPPETNMSREDLDAVVKLARLLQNPHEPYDSLPETRRADMRRGAMRIVQALIMLEWIEAPA